MTQPAKQRKRDAVGNLRDLAAELGVDMGGRRKADLSESDFLALHSGVLAEARTPEHHRRAAGALNLYRGPDDSGLPAVPKLPSLPVAVGGVGSSGAADVASAPEENGFRLRSSSCLFTWNSTEFAKVELEVSWLAFLTWLKACSFVRRWTATAERSLKSADSGRLHLHAFVEFVKAVDWTSLEYVRFRGSLPNASPTRARGDNVQQVKDQGHFYCWACKPGTMKVQTSGHEPWFDYQVKGSWMDELWSQHKLDHETYLGYASKVRVGFVNRCKHVEAVRERERADQLRQRRAEVALKLAPLQKAFKDSVLQELLPWKDQYSHIEARYKFLVLRGASRTGKSTLGRSLGQALGFGGIPFVQTVQSALAPDLRAYKSENHSFIVFDNVNDMKFVLDYRALFQANNDVHTLGESKTGMYSYDVWLFQVPLVLTVDMSAKWDSGELWIKDNCVEVLLHGPSWIE